MSLEQNANRLMTALTGLAPPASVLNDAVGAGIMSGTVTSVNPLSITLENRDIVTERWLTLSPLCKRATFENFVPTEETGRGGGDPEAFESHVHNFVVGLWRGLKIGDPVTIFVSSNKQQYYCLSRPNMVFGDMDEG